MAGRCRCSERATGGARRVRGGRRGGRAGFGARAAASARSRACPLGAGALVAVAARAQPGAARRGARRPGATWRARLGTATGDAPAWCCPTASRALVLLEVPRRRAGPERTRASAVRGPALSGGARRSWTCCRWAGARAGRGRAAHGGRGLRSRRRPRAGFAQERLDLAPLAALAALARAGAPAEPAVDADAGRRGRARWPPRTAARCAPSAAGGATRSPASRAAGPGGGRARPRWRGRPAAARARAWARARARWCASWRGRAWRPSWAGAWRCRRSRRARPPSWPGWAPRWHEGLLDAAARRGGDPRAAAESPWPAWRWPASAVLPRTRPGATRERPGHAATGARASRRPSLRARAVPRVAPRAGRACWRRRPC